MLLSLTVTALMFPLMPLTKMLEGYGVAGPLVFGTVIAPVLQNWFPFTTVWLFTVCVMEPLLVWKLTVPL
jgi:hypothetical protein